MDHLLPPAPPPDCPLAMSFRRSAAIAASPAPPLNSAFEIAADPSTIASQDHSMRAVCGARHAGLITLVPLAPSQRAFVLPVPLFPAPFELPALPRCGHSWPLLSGQDPGCVRRLPPHRAATVFNCDPVIAVDLRPRHRHSKYQLLLPPTHHCHRRQRCLPPPPPPPPIFNHVGKHRQAPLPAWSIPGAPVPLPRHPPAVVR